MRKLFLLFTCLGLFFTLNNVAGNNSGNMGYALEYQRATVYLDICQNAAPEGVYYNVATRKYQYFPIGSPLSNCKPSTSVYIPPKTLSTICMKKETNEVVNCRDKYIEDEIVCYDALMHKYKKCSFK